MNSREVLSKAYSITTHNPINWLFGLVLLGGFNLSFLNLFVFLPKSSPELWLSSFDILPIVIVGIVGFLFSNALKVIFIVTLHKNIHTQRFEQCALCVKKDSVIPFGFWYVHVLIASFITIFLTAAVMISMNFLFSMKGQEASVAVIANFILVAIITILLGTWNIFTTFFVVLHDLKFTKASALAIDLITLQFRKVIEFVIQILVIYSVAVLLSHALLYFWQVQSLHSIVGQNAAVIHFVISFVVLVWVAIHNVFFNTSLLVFFDDLVKTIGITEPSSGLLPANRLN